MRKIDTLIIHCTASAFGKEVSVAELDKLHKSFGWSGIGYHFVVHLDGSVSKGREVAQIGSHCKGFNSFSIGIAYVGGLDEHGKPSDTRTEAQKQALEILVQKCVLSFPIVRIVGHRDCNPSKACPCFDAKKEYQQFCNYI